MTEPLIALKRSTVFDAKVNELLILPCSSINNTDNLLTSISLSDKPEIRQKNNIGHASCGFPCSQKEGFENVSLDLMNKVPLDTNNNNNNCKINQDEVSSNSTPPRLINPACARLIPYKPLYLPIASTTQGGMSSCGNKLSFSTSGLTVTSQDSTVQTAISSIGLNSGEHIWQFICPISCEGVEFGVVSVETGQEMFLSFNTTTPRQLIFKVNFDNLRFLVFLNGNLHEKKSTNLPVISKKESSFWYPAVRLKETGMTVIFNPFAVDPSYISSTNSFAVITNDTQSSGQVYTNSLEIENKVQQAIQRIEEAPDMIEIIDHKDKEKSDINLINEEIKRNKNSLNNSIEGVINKDNLILLRRRDGKLKLIRRTCSGRFNLDSCSAFENKPRNASDSVWLILSRVEWKKLFIGIDWSKLQSKQDGVQQQVDQKGEKDSTKNSPNHIVLFLNSFIENTLTQGDYLHMYIQFDVASAIIQILCSSLNQMFINSQNYHSTVNNISQLPSQEPADIFLFPSSQDHPFEHLIQLMTISFALLEQLFGMTLHSSTQASLINFIQPQLSRSYSSYSRLSSLISSCKNDSYSQIELAEIGVYNTSDMLQSLQHFASPNIPLQLQIPQGNCSLKPSLTKDLFLQLPNNRMLRGEMYFNIPLHVTINSIPYSQHSSACKNPNQNKHQASDYWIISSQSSNNSHNYICSACFDGSVNVWNTEIQLFSVLLSDFTALFVPPKQLKGLWSTNDLKANLKNVELGLFYSTGKNEDILKQSEIRNQPSNAAQLDATKANLTTWTCKHCTFINTDTQHKQLVCTMCLQNRDNNPNNSKNNQGNTSDNVDIPAYQDPVIDDQSRYLLSLKKQGRINEYKVQRGQGVMAVSKLSKLCPLIVGLCLTKQNQEQVKKQHGSNEQKEQNSKKTISLLRLRRFGFSPEYLSNFYKLTQTIPSSSNSSSQSSSTKPNLEQQPATFNEISLLSSQTGSSIISQRGLVSQLSGELLSESTMGCIEDTIFRTENSRISVECLEPMFMSNNRFSSDSKPHSEQLLDGNTRKQHSLVNQSWIATCERDIVLSEGVKIKDSLLELNNSNWSVSNPKHLNRQEIYSLFILTDECSILMYQIILDNVNPYNPDSLQVSVLNSISLSSMIFKEVADQDNNSEDTMSDQSTLLMLQQHQQSQALLVLLNSKSIINVLLHKEQLVQQKSRQASIIQSFTQPILSYCSNNQGGISFLLDASNHQESSQCLKSFEIITIPFIEQQSLKVSVKQQSEEQEDGSQLIDKSTKLHQEQISFDTHFLRQLKAYLEYSPLGSRVISNQKQNKACAISQSCSSLSCHRLLDSTTQLWARHAFNNTITLSFDDNTTNLLAGKNFNVFNHLTLHLEYSSNNQQPNISSGYASNKQQLTDKLSSCDLVSLSAVEYISAECLRLQDHSDFSELSNPSTKPIHLPLMLVTSKGAQLSFQQQVITITASQKNHSNSKIANDYFD